MAKDLIKKCSRCGKEGDAGLFGKHKARADGLSEMCKACDRARCAAYRKTAKYREARDAYRSRPEIRERERRQHAEYARRNKIRLDAYDRSVRGRLVSGRSKARIALRKATDPARIAVLESLVQSYESEMRRLGVAMRP